MNKLNPNIANGGMNSEINVQNPNINEKIEEIHKGNDIIEEKKDFHISEVNNPENIQQVT